MTRRILALVDDMFFASKIRASAEALGVDVSFPRTRDLALTKLRENQPDIILADLQNQRVDVIDLVAEMKADSELNQIRVLGFYSHVEVELQQKARQAGFDQVIPRSAFARDLGRILSGGEGCDDQRVP